jgi:hypothetical protein
MADGKFVGDPNVLIPKGNEMESLGAEFLKETDTVYKTVDNIVQNQYISPEAMEIKKEIDKYKADLEKMSQTMTNYGQVTGKAGQKIINNQNNIIDEIK